ncbi:hypothetical protein [Nostoc sp.]
MVAYLAIAPTYSPLPLSDWLVAGRSHIFLYLPKPHEPDFEPLAGRC